MALVWPPNWITCRLPAALIAQVKKNLGLGNHVGRSSGVERKIAGAKTDTVAIIDPRHAAKQLIYERIFRSATLSAAILVLLILGGVAVSLLRGAWPAIHHFGFSFVTREIWNPVTDEYGALAPIYGTVVTSAIAMLLAVPAGFGIALFLTELCPPLLKRPIGVAVELLAAVPSIIFGIWGLFVLAPVLQRHVQPWLIAHLGHVPYAGNLFKGPPFGIGVLTAGVVLAIMVLPFIAATMRDVFDTVPPMLKESGTGWAPRLGK